MRANVRPNASLDVVARFSRIDKCKVRSEENEKARGAAAGRGEVKFGTTVDQTAENETFQKTGVGPAARVERAWGCPGGVSI